MEQVIRGHEPRSDDRLAIDSTRLLSQTLADALAFIHTDAA